MTVQQIEQALRATLEDRRLSRSERRALSQVFDESRLTPQQRGAVRSMAVSLAREAMSNELAPEDTLDWLDDVLKLLLPDMAAAEASPRSQACFSPGEECRQRIQSSFRHARKRADVCVFTITDDRITSAIVDAHHRGVSVRVITDDDKSQDRGSDIDILARCNIEVRIDRTRHHMHHKFAIFDEATLLTGSYNWTLSAMRHNEENLIVTEDAGLVRAFSNEFCKLWEKFA